MATSFDNFRLPQTHRFISYSGPPPQKSTSRRCDPKNAPCTADKWHDLDQTLESALGSNSTSKDRGILGPRSRTVETVDLTCLDGKIGGGGGGEGGGGSSCGGVRVDGDFSFQDECIEGRDESSTQPAIAKGSSRENAVVINDEPDSDTDEEDEHRPREDGGDTQTDNQLEGADTLAVENLSDGCPPTGMEDAIESEMVEGAGILVSPLPSREPTSTPSKSTVYDSPPRTSGDGNAMKSVHFADKGLMTNHSIYQPTHQPQSPMETKVKRQCEFPTLENASSSSDSDSDVNESDYQTMTRKRKRSQLANTVSRKRHTRTTNTTLGRRPQHAANSVRRQKQSPSGGGPLSSRLSVPEPASGARFGGCDAGIRYGDSSDESSEESGDPGRRPRSNERPKSIASHDFPHKRESKRDRGNVPPSQSNTESPFPLSTHTPPHATGETRSRPSAKGQAQQHLPDIAIHPLSADMAFLTALFRGRSDMGTLSTTQAVTLLENVVGHPTKLGNITIKPVTPDIWFLTCFMHYASDTAGRRTDQPALALPSLPVTRADTVSPRDDPWSSDDDVDDESSSDNDEHQSNSNHEPSSSRKQWSQEDDDRLRKWKEEGRPWDWICSQFPSRSPGAVQVRWYSKLREKA